MSSFEILVSKAPLSGDDLKPGQCAHQEKNFEIWASTVLSPHQPVFFLKQGLQKTSKFGIAEAYLSGDLLQHGQYTPQTSKSGHPECHLSCNCPKLGKCPLKLNSQAHLSGALPIKPTHRPPVDKELRDLVIQRLTSAAISCAASLLYRFSCSLACAMDVQYGLLIKETRLTVPACMHARALVRRNA